MASPLLRQKLVDLTEERLKLEENEGLLDITSLAYLSEKEKRRTVITSQLLEITDDMLDKMVCKMESKLFIRGAFWGAAQLLLRAYSAIHVAESEVDRLRDVAREAAKKKQSIIFLPRHTSHVDYVTLQLICYRLGMTLPVVIAGDNCMYRIVSFHNTRTVLFNMACVTRGY
jgi:glycerol-3-phosphate O-acyltransferase